MPYNHAIIILLCLIIGLAHCNNLKQQQASIFVSPKGSDSSGDGTFSHPYQSFSKAISKANPDDVIVLGSGIYSPKLACGTIPFPIKVSGFPAVSDSRKAIVDGSGSSSDCWVVTANNGVVFFSTLVVRNIGVAIRRQRSSSIDYATKKIEVANFNISVTQSKFDKISTSAIVADDLDSLYVQTCTFINSKQAISVDYSQSIKTLSVSVSTFDNAPLNIYHSTTVALSVSTFKNCLSQAAIVVKNCRDKFVVTATLSNNKQAVNAENSGTVAFASAKFNNNGMHGSVEGSSVYSFNNTQTTIANVEFDSNISTTSTVYICNTAKDVSIASSVFKNNKQALKLKKFINNGNGNDDVNTSGNSCGAAWSCCACKMIGQSNTYSNNNPPATNCK